MADKLTVPTACPSSAAETGIAPVAPTSASSAVNAPRSARDASRRTVFCSRQHRAPRPGSPAHERRRHRQGCSAPPNRSSPRPPRERTPPTQPRDAQRRPFQHRRARRYYGSSVVEFYNPVRRNSARNLVSPAQFEQQAYNRTKFSSLKRSRSKIEPDRAADDLARKAVAGVAGAGWWRHPGRRRDPVRLSKPPTCRPRRRFVGITSQKVVMKLAHPDGSLGRKGTSHENCGGTDA